MPGVESLSCFTEQRGQAYAKDSQKLKALVLVMHSLARVLTSAKWAVPKARSVRQAIPPGSFQSISWTVQAILSNLYHFKYELLNEKPH